MEWLVAWICLSCQKAIKVEKEGLHQKPRNYSWSWKERWSEPQFQGNLPCFTDFEQKLFYHLIEYGSTSLSRKSVSNTYQSNIIHWTIWTFWNFFLWFVCLLLSVIFLYFLRGPFLDLSHRLRCLFGTKCNLFSNWSTRGIFTFFFVLPPFFTFPSFKKHIFAFDTDALCLLKWYQRLGFHWQISFSLSLFQEMKRYKYKYWKVLSCLILSLVELEWQKITINTL